MIEKILVTGATGNVGFKTVQDLLEKKAFVKCAVRSVKKAKKMGLFFSSDVVKFDYLSPHGFELVLDDVDKILIIAPLDANMYLMLIPFLDYIPKRYVKQVVFLSALGVDRDETNPLRQIELKIQKMKIAHTIVRSNFFMQNFTTGFLSDGVSKGTIKISAGEGATSFMDSRDVAEFLSVVLTEQEHENKIYEITGNEAITYNQAASTMAEVLKRDIKYLDVNEEEMRRVLKNKGISKDTVEFMLSLYRPVRKGLAARITPTFNEVLRKNPRKFEEFLNETVVKKIPSTAFI
ncbi:MAG: NmrA family NAD(P)-binding protein [Candidatus Lokiarchaeota archaeon]|nr:NmrA family NAD(P)-binding protein [Candidatus Lokiarchaeota archaeon]